MNLQEISSQEKLELLNNPKYLCRLAFKSDNNDPLEVTTYQADIIKEILFRKHRRAFYWASTQAGKSLAVAIGIILLCRMSEGRKVKIIAPTVEHTTIIMGYIIQHIFDTEYISSGLAESKGMSVERLKKELSKKRITWKDNNDIEIISANIATEGRSLIGKGGTDIFIDETEKIPIEIVDTKIMRMLGATVDSRIFCISNPTAKGFMYKESRLDEERRKRGLPEIWHKVTIHWQQAVEEGRLSIEFVEEQKIRLSPIEFKIWYDSEYPEDYADTLIKWEWIQKARDKRRLLEPTDDWKKMNGLDVAEMGNDLTVLTNMLTMEKVWYQKGIYSWGKVETMQTVKMAIPLITMTDKTKVDATGVGSGVYSRLKELGYNVVDVKAGRSCEDPKDRNRFKNQKAEMYWKLRELFENGNIAIMEHKILEEQLNGLRYEIIGGLIQIIDPDDGKSPDFSDSLALACFILVGGETKFITTVDDIFGNERVIRDSVHDGYKINKELEEFGLE